MPEHYSLLLIYWKEYISLAMMAESLLVVTVLVVCDRLDVVQSVKCIVLS